MANEYLKRTPTSTGNRRVFTWSGWVKRNSITNGSPQSLFTGGVNASDRGVIDFNDVDTIRFGFNNSSWYLTETTDKFRDTGSWMNVIVSVNLTTSGNEDVSIYVNGIKRSSSAVTWPSIVNNVFNEQGYGMYITSTYGQLNAMYEGEMFDVFWVDGQALTPDVFGFYKDGDGYMSSGTANATDFKPGQWMPHSPSKIKKDINRRGGFGVNGYYLPMNDSSNPGADFHCASDTIIKLKGEDLPQPRNGAPTTSDSYVSQLRTHTGGLFNDGVVNFNGSGDRNALQDSGNAVNLGTGAFTVEAFVYHSDLPQNALQYIFMNTSQSNINTFAFAVENDRIVAGKWAGSFSNSTKVEATLPVGSLKTGRWYHYAACRSGNTLRLFIDGKMVVQDTSHTENYNNTSQYGCRVGCESGAGATVAGYKPIRGFISNVRVVNGTALYTSNFTPPTEPLTNVTNTVLLCCQSPTSATAAAVSPGTLSLLTETGDRAAFAARNELDASIVLAVPGITGGQSSGYGDYSADIRGNGSNKTVTANGNATVASVSSYYGSTLSFDGNASTNFSLGNNNDFDFGSDDFTIEFWRKRNSISDSEAYFTKYGGGSAANNSFWFGALNTGRDSFYWYDNDGEHSIVTSNNSMSVNQFDHLCAERYGGTVSLYINGVVVAVDYHDIIVNNVVPLNVTTYNVKIGANDDSDGTVYYPFDGEIQDLRVYRGLAKYKGGFDVPKPYTPVGIEAFRTTADTCKNNFATLNSIQSSMSLTDGNLTCTSSGNNQESYSTFGITTGKWYVEARTNVGTYNHFGLRANSTTTYGSSYRLIARDDGNVYGDSSEGQVGTLSDNYNQAGDIVAMAIDGDNGQVTYYVNGVNVGGPYSIYQYSSAPTPYKVYNLANNGDSLTFNFGQNPSFSGQVTAGTNADGSGKGLFKYAPPSGFLALCEDNLPTPAIADPGKHFKAILYEGDNTPTNEVKGVGFQPDLIFFKNRDDTVGWNIFDSVRGPSKQLRSESFGADVTRSGGGCFFNEDGFTVSNRANNNNPNSYVAYCWKAGGVIVPNTDGSITSQVSANQDAGFSIVSYTGNGTNLATVGHGLNKEVKFMITKSRTTTDNWVVHTNVTGTQTYSFLNTSATLSSDSVTAPSSSVFYRGTSDTINGNTKRYISYCFAEIEGYSKIGTYVGNANADGAFVYCGFKPAWVMVKSSSTTSNWLITDNARNPTNPVDLDFYANLNNAESQYARFDYVSNGFKVRNTSSEMNTNNVTYIFIAFAESPFQTANAK